MNIQLDYYNGSIIGLTISQSLMLTDSFNWGNIFTFEIVGFRITTKSTFQGFASTVKWKIT